MDSDHISKNSDYFLWSRFRSGDKKALSDIFYLKYNVLYNYGLRLYNEPDFIKDCIQELFYELITRLSSLGPTDNITLYLIASLRRKVFDKLKNNNTYNYDDNEELPNDFTVDTSHEEEIITREEEQVESQKINDMLEELPAREKEAVYLRYYRNFSYKQITQVMDVNYQSARKIVYRAMNTLREKSKNKFSDKK